jgi:integrase
MEPTVPTRTVTVAGDIRPPAANPAAAVALTPAGQAALATAQAFARKAAAANTLRAYRAARRVMPAPAAGATARWLLFGFVGALRRSELVALRVEDVAMAAGGLRLRIARGKMRLLSERKCNGGDGCTALAQSQLYRSAPV